MEWQRIFQINSIRQVFLKSHLERPKKPDSVYGLWVNPGLKKAAVKHIVGEFEYA